MKRQKNAEEEGEETEKKLSGADINLTNGKVD